MRNFRSHPMRPRAAGPQSFACETPLSQVRGDVNPLESFACETAGPARCPVIGAVLARPKRRSP
jgi:hypothetical protein